MTAATEIVGSWFPTGYHGHFRSKSRTDFICEYRQLAKPQPPKKFINRARQPTARHVFSHHDNREAFLNDALYFEQGLGRKRNPNRAYSFKKDFMTWMPEREYIERSMRPLSSTYRVDYKNSIPRVKNQLYVQSPRTSFDGVDTTSYRYSHGSEYANPNRETINAMNNDALKLSLLNRKNRAMSAKAPVRETVASCMNWYDPSRENVRPKTAYIPKPPAAESQSGMYQPQPPTEPRQETAPPRIIQTAPPAPQQQQQQPEVKVQQTVVQPPPPERQTTMPVEPPQSNSQPVVAWSPPQPTTTAEPACT